MTTHQKTIPSLLEARCKLSPDVPAFYELDSNKYWQPVNWSEFKVNVNRISAALLNAGVRKGDRVGIMAPTSLNWEYAQMGALSIAAIVVGIDQNYQLDQLEHIFEILNPSVLFVQDHRALLKIPAELRRRIKLIILFEGSPCTESEQSMEKILAVNRSIGHHNNFIAPVPEDIAVIVFSSGTTGVPKAIHYSHLQLLIAIEAIQNAFEDIKEGAVFLCWLPLASLFQRVVNFWGVGIGAASYILSDPRDLMKYIRSVNPVILIGVPRLFIRMHSGIDNYIRESKWPFYYLISLALRIGREHALVELSTKRVGVLSRALWYFVDKLFLVRIRAMFGSRLRYCISGSAAMPLWLVEWFEGIGLPVLEAYGVSENVIPIAINRPTLRRLGTVGKPLLPNEVRLAEDGEVLVRGPGVFGGYWEMSGNSIAERFTADGYLCTNDLGYFDEDGFLSLVGRKSDAFKTPEGKWISPARIEGQLQRIVYIEQCIVFQLRLGKVAAILSIDKQRHLEAINLLTKKESISVQNNAMDIFSQMLRNDINEKLHDLPKYQLPIGIVVTYDQFTIERGELTTNMKPRRDTIISHFLPIIERLELECKQMLQEKNSLKHADGISPVILFV